MLTQYLTSKGLEYKAVNNQFRVKQCPFCNDNNWHFYIRQDLGLWDCKHCFSSGSFNTLRRHYGDIGKLVKGYKEKKKRPKIIQYENKFDQSAINYLLCRGISEALIKEKNIFCEKQKYGFPYYDYDGNLLNIKWRTFPTKSFYYQDSSEVYLPYNYTPFLSDEVYLTEGELDALSLMQLGYENVIGVPGAGNFKGSWVELFDRYKVIYLIMDNDEAGQRGIEQISGKLGRARCRIVDLPLKDISELLEARIERKEFDILIKESRMIESEDYKHISDIKYRARSESSIGITTGIELLDNLTLWREGELSVFTGDTKQGKTTLALYLILQQLKRGIACLIASYEMPIRRIKEKLCMMLEEMEFDNESEERRHSAWELLDEYPLYYVNIYNSNIEGEIKVDMDILESAIVDTCKYRDVGFVLIDHLHQLLEIRSNQNLAYEIGQTVRRIKKINLRLSNNIFLIVHPSKVERGKDITENDLRGSSDIKQLCDNVFRVKKIVGDYGSDQASLDLLIARHDSTRLGGVLFNYDKPTNSFRENK